MSSDSKYFLKDVTGITDRIWPMREKEELKQPLKFEACVSRRITLPFTEMKRSIPFIGMK